MLELSLMHQNAGDVHNDHGEAPGGGKHTDWEVVGSSRRIIER